MIIQLVRNMFAKKYRLIAALLFISGACCQADNLQPVPSETEDASQFVTLTDVVPDAILEIRYFGTYNFVGARIDGYLEPTALLTREAADSLQAVTRGITPAQFANRMILRRAMMRHGFKPISSEWWHFTLKKEPFPHTYFTFPVKQLNR